MELHGFLSALLPSGAQGTYFVYFKPLNKPILQSPPLSNLPHVEAYIEACGDKQGDVYVATGQFRGKKRNQQQLIAKHTFYIDIDCGEGKAYPTKAAALEALYLVLKAKRLPLPSLIVDSGHGIHVYWVISAPIGKDEWEPVAKRIVSTCREYQLHIDPGVTIDSARIMRVPGTLNYKDPQDAKPCAILRDLGKAYSLKQFESSLPQLSKPNLKVVQKRPLEVPSDLSAGLHNDDPALVKNIIANCGVFKEMYETRGQHQSEVLWKDCLTVLSYCEDGTKWLHPLSEGHPGYSVQETDAKYEQRKVYDVGPTRCETFEKHCGDICKACKYREAPWVGSPLSLGRGAIQEQAKQTRKVDYPAGYMATTRGTFRRGDEDEFWFVLAEHITEMHLAEDAEFGYIITCQVALPGNPDATRQFTTNLQAINSATSELLAKDAARGGISVHTKAQAIELKRLMATWIQQLREAKQVTTIVRQYGWVNHSQPGFALGSRIYYKDGTEGTSVVSDSHMQSIYNPSGEFKAWQEVAKFLVGQNRQSIAMAIAAAFGSPLLCFTGAAGVVVSLYSAASGTGKTTALRASQSVWGDPKHGIHVLGDTINSVSKQLEVKNNLPGYWDEMRMRKQVEGFAQLIFQLGAGKGKSRLNARAELQKTGSWETMIMAATNESLRDHLEQLIRGTDAGALRLFEVQVPEIETDQPISEVMYLFSKLERNYGHAGKMYAKWLAGNQDTAKALVRAVMRELGAEVRSEHTERFWLATVTAILAGAMLSTKLGILQFDLDALREYLCQQFVVQRARTKVQVEATNAIALLLTYLQDNKASSLHTNVTHGAVSAGGDHKNVYIVANEDRLVHPIVYQVSDDNWLSISKSHFQRWLYTTQNVMPTPVVNELAMKYKFRQVRGTLGAGLGHKGLPRQRLLRANITWPELKNHFDES